MILVTKMAFSCHTVTDFTDFGTAQKVVATVGTA